MRLLLLRTFTSIAICMSFARTASTADGPARPEDFPAMKELPDPLAFLDGSRVKTREDWKRRRAEILDLILSIQYGHLPPAPGNVKRISGISRKTINDGATLLEKHTLSMGPENRIAAQVDLYLPAKMNEPCPVILNVGWGCPIVKEVNERGYIFAGFGPDRFDRSEEGKPTPGAVELAYPDNDGGTLAAWAWGASRMLDYLETLPQVDASKVIVTGHSRCGKAALLAGAVDERFAMVVPNGSGCGGAGLYRILGPACEDLEAITRPERWQEWFHKDLRAYAGGEAHLPFDQHFMRALVAPRPVLSTDGTVDVWANPIGTQINYLAAQPVYDFLGVPERNGIHFRSGGHDHKDQDWRALLDFADWHLFGKRTERRFDKLPLPGHPLVASYRGSGRELPERAVVLFDGEDLSHWVGEKGAPPKWKIIGDAVEVVPGAGSIMTKKVYNDFRLHLEFKVPVPEEGANNSGNSGVYLLRRYEVQILNSFGKKPGASECGGIYKSRAPDENAARPAGEWQSYDITFTAPRWKGARKTENARITVVHNGKLIHDDVSVPNKTGAGQPEMPFPNPILLQDHGSKVQFRNIWILERDAAKPAD